MKNSSPDTNSNALDARLALAAQQLTALDNNEIAVARQTRLKADILKNLPPHATTQAEPADWPVNWLLQGWLRPAVAALLPAIIGFAAGVWVPAETPAADLELYADLRLGHEDLFNLDAATNEHKQ